MPLPTGLRESPRTKAQFRAEPVAGSTASAGLEDTIWLCPVEDRRKLDSAREGMLEAFSLGSYLLLVEYTGAVPRGEERDFRRTGGNSRSVGHERGRLAAPAGEAQMRATAGPILARQSQSRTFAERKATIELAARLGVHHLANLGGRTARWSELTENAWLSWARRHIERAIDPLRRAGLRTLRAIRQSIGSSLTWHIAVTAGQACRLDRSLPTEPDCGCCFFRFPAPAPAGPTSLF